jgi:hypothetical protein
VLRRKEPVARRWNGRSRDHPWESAISAPGPTTTSGMGPITLFAALNYLDGKILSRAETGHTHVEWLRFLKQLDRETPSDQQVHLIVDNYATHKHEKVRKWLKRHPRVILHFTPVGSSWMNLVERFFADLTQDCVREGSFESVRELIEVDRRLPGSAERRAEAVCVARKRGRYPAQDRESQGGAGSTY